MVQATSRLDGQRMTRAHDLIDDLGPVEHLLVVTPPNGSGRHGLQLAFRSATVIEASQEGLMDLGRMQRPADLAIIEAPANDVLWALRIINSVRPALPGDALITVIFPRDLVVAREPASPAPADGAGIVPEGGLPDLQVHSTGLLGGVVGLVLRPAASVAVNGTDPWNVLATFGRVVYLETMAAESHEAGTSEPLMAKRLRAELRRLSAQIESETESRERAEERYRALLRSRLGRVMSRYWRLRKSLTGGPRR